MSTPTPLEDEDAVDSQKMEADFKNSLNAGEDVNHFPGFDTTPLIMSIIEGVPAVSELLIMRGADVNRSDRHISTPLHCATSSEHASSTETVALLLRHKADINAHDMNATPIFEAIARDKIDAVKLLLTHDPDLTIRNSDHETPLEYARKLGKSKIAELLEAQVEKLKP